MKCFRDLAPELRELAKGFILITAFLLGFATVVAIGGALVCAMRFVWGI